MRASVLVAHHFSCHCGCRKWGPSAQKTQGRLKLLITAYKYPQSQNLACWYPHVCQVSEDCVGLLGKNSVLISALVYTGEQQSCVLQWKTEECPGQDPSFTVCTAQLFMPVPWPGNISFADFNSALLSVTSETVARQNILTLPLLHMQKLFRH